MAISGAGSAKGKTVPRGSALRVAAIILLSGTAALGAVMLYRLCRHNVLALVTLAAIACGLSVAALLERRDLNEEKSALSRRSLAAAAVLAAGLAAWIPLPLTGVSLRIHKVYESTEFAIRRSRPVADASFVSVYRTRGMRDTDLNFILPAPIGSGETALRFYPGQRPRRLYYGRHFFPCDIQRLSFGTDIFFVYVPLVRFEGRDILPMLKPSPNGSLRDIDGHTLRAWGPVSIETDGARIRTDARGFRVLMIKCFWALILLAAFWLGMWSRALFAADSRWRHRAEYFLAT